MAIAARNVAGSYGRGLFEVQAGRWRKLDQGLKDLAVMAAATAIGCGTATFSPGWSGSSSNTPRR